jgi:uncharacterized protein
VHISQLADKFVKDPREVVKAGDIVKVRVVEVDAARKRIALTMRSGEIATKAAGASTGTAGQRSSGAGSAPGRMSAAPPPAGRPGSSGAGVENAFAAALRRAQEGKR